ncbi:MAG TPA: beta-propeller fold lactonase family protein, partial [Nitrospira sp.]|nr:beta-propeller fold lactonase family protein [Nitrospira sp.]
MSATLPFPTHTLRRSVIGMLSILAFVPLLYFAACSSDDDNGGGASNNTPPPGGGSTANQLGYVIDAVGAQIRAFNVDGNNGNLSPIGNPVFTGSFPHHVDVDPRGRYLYVANHGFNDTPFLSGFRINADGTLAAMTEATASYVTSDPATEGNPHSSVMDANGQFLYVVAGLNASTLRAYTIDTSTGLLTLIPGQSFAVGEHAHNITMSPNGQFVFTAGGPEGGAGEVHSFLRNGDGTLTPKSTITGLVEATSVAVSPQSNLLYAASVNQISVYTIAQDGALALIEAPNTFETFQSVPHSIALDPTGQFLYVANLNSNSITVFQVDTAGR